jgi:NADH:ubiquinone oxidoreductase subunit K
VDHQLTLSSFSDLLGLFSGITLRINIINWFQILWHFVALTLTILFFLYNWQYTTMWYIFALFVVPVSICESVVIASTILFGFRKY